MSPRRYLSALASRLRSRQRMLLWTWSALLLLIFGYANAGVFGLKVTSVEAFGIAWALALWLGAASLLLVLFPEEKTRSRRGAALVEVMQRLSPVLIGSYILMALAYSFVAVSSILRI